MAEPDRLERPTAAISSTAPLSVQVSLDQATLTALADMVAERLSSTVDGARTTRWLTAPQAADHLAAPVSRIRKLTMTGDLPHHHDGGRVLYDRAELDAYVRGRSLSA